MTLDFPLNPFQADLRSLDEAGSGVEVGGRWWEMAAPCPADTALCIPLSNPTLLNWNQILPGYWRCLRLYLFQAASEISSPLSVFNQP